MLKVPVYLLGCLYSDIFWNQSCLFVIIIPADSRLFDCTCYFEHGRFV